jgi:glycosyltransferase involved in cell wall biosynthesis
MPVYNCGDFLQESIDSVLAQTLHDFELIVVNDGSTDDSSQIAHSYIDKRIKVIDTIENRGCYPARNIGMRTAKGNFICVMDADDICYPERLEKQFLFLKNNPDFGMVGTAYQICDSYDILYKETDYETIKIMLMKFCYLRHPTCMIRANNIEKYNLYYDEQYIYASDYDWIVRASSVFPISNINEPMLIHRKHVRQISSKHANEQGYYADNIRINQLSFLDIECTDDERDIHLNFINIRQRNNIDENTLGQWIDKLLTGNNRTQYYSQKKIQIFLEAHCYMYLHQNNNNA